VFVALALAMFGWYELQLPAALRHRLSRASQGQRGGTVAGAAAMGVVSALLVGPCMTAPLAGALLYIGNTGDVLTGGLALFFMFVVVSMLYYTVIACMKALRTNRQTSCETPYQAIPVNG
jgi:thiol:disulfide interchange protein